MHQTKEDKTRVLTSSVHRAVRGFGDVFAFRFVSAESAAAASTRGLLLAVLAIVNAFVGDGVKSSEIVWGVKSKARATSHRDRWRFLSF